MSNPWWRMGTAMFFLSAVASLGVAASNVKEEAARFEALLKQHHQSISTPEGKAYEKEFMNQYQAPHRSVEAQALMKLKIMNLYVEPPS